MVELPLIHQAVPLSRPRKKITVTIELCSALTGASRPEHTQGSARLYMFETSMFEHPLLPDDITAAQSQIGNSGPTPLLNN